MSVTQKPRVPWQSVLRSTWRGPQIIWANDLLEKRCTALEIEQEDLQELNYRKGYQQGYSQAMDDMLAIANREYSRPRECWNFLARFFDGPLTMWRYAIGPQNGRGLVLPPRPELPQRWSQLRDAARKRDQACVHCGTEHGLECDHIVPVKDGGVAELDNLRMLCGHCHKERARR